MPDFIAADPDASQAWHQVIAALPTGFLAASDMPTVAVFASSWSLYCRAQEMIRSDGAEARGSAGQRKASPGIVISEKMATRLAQSADALGLSPSARARFGLVPSTPPDDDPGDRLTDLLRG